MHDVQSKPHIDCGSFLYIEVGVDDCKEMDI